MAPAVEPVGRRAGPVAVLDAAGVPPRGQALCLEVDWEGHALPLVLLRRPGGRLVGWVNLCPHQAVPLAAAGAAVLDRGRRHLVCGQHGALFRPDDGLCVAGPCAGDRLSPIEAVELMGQVQLFLPPALAAELRARRAVVSALSPIRPAPGGPGPAGPGGSTPG